MVLTKTRIEEIESLTSDLLKESYGDLSIIPPVDLNRIIRHSGLTVKLGNFQDPTIEGAYDRNQKTIYLASSSSATRQAFTAAHELGHFYLHKDLPKEVFYRKDDLDCNISQDTEEQEANWFAASILMPKILIIHFKSLLDDTSIIAEKFGVSALATFYRLKNFGLINE